MLVVVVRDIGRASSTRMIIVFFIQHGSMRSLTLGNGVNNREIRAIQDVILCPLWTFLPGNWPGWTVIMVIVVSASVQSFHRENIRLERCLLWIVLVGSVYSHSFGHDNLEVLSVFLILNKHERFLLMKSLCRLRPFVVASCVASHLLYRHHRSDYLQRFWMVILPSAALCSS